MRLQRITGWGPSACQLRRHTSTASHQGAEHLRDTAKNGSALVLRPQAAVTAGRVPPGGPC